MQTDDLSIQSRMEILREETKKSILLECSINPTEWICSVGWHHRGLWMQDFRVVGEEPNELLSQIEEHFRNERENKK